MRKFFFLLIFTFIILSSQAQHRCATVEYMNYLYSKNPALKREHEVFNQRITDYLNAKKQYKVAAVQEEEIYEIPVVVHVVYNNYAGGVTNIPDAQIHSQIDILNKDYRRLNADTGNTYAIFKPVAADIKIQFCLATVDPEGRATSGINRIFNKQPSFAVAEGPSLKQLSYWPSDAYLNIWVCNIAPDDFGNEILGYTQMPDSTGLTGLADSYGTAATDGVVIHYKYFGDVSSTTPYYNKGRTATHEVGHWFGMIHIWGDTYCGNDYVNDTPPQTHSNLVLNCDTLISHCVLPDTISMTQNYMDYSMDACMNIFTQGQKDRMRAAMEISPRRKALLNSSGCCAPGYLVALPQEVTFEDESYLDNHWQILNFDASSPYSKAWTEVSPGAYGQSSKAFMIENDSVYTSSDTTYWDAFQSPAMDLSAVQKPMLDFDLAYAYGTGNLNTDSLVLYYNAGCKNRWRPYTTLYGSSLVTTDRRTNNFEPRPEEWKRISIDLEDLKGIKQVSFRMAVFSKGINNLYIDNLNFYKEADQMQLLLYPVPVEGDELTLELIYDGYRDVKIEAFNTLGQKLFEKTKTTTTSFKEMISTSNLSAGVYIIRVTAGGEKQTKRFIVR